MKEQKITKKEIDWIKIECPMCERLKKEYKKTTTKDRKKFRHKNVLSKIGCPLCAVHRGKTRGWIWITKDMIIEEK